jgi:membrane protein implicated in regulation of membrane protease activity
MREKLVLKVFMVLVLVNAFLITCVMILNRTLTPEELAMKFWYLIASFWSTSIIAVYLGERYEKRKKNNNLENV